ncbi:MAG: hypothetical protein ACFFB5_19920 [Promethearchaeota archaeon]
MRRLLAIPNSGGIEHIHDETSEHDSFVRVRSKWVDYDVKFNYLTNERIKFALESAANARNLLTADLGELFDTNALIGTGIMDLWDSIIQEKLKEKMVLKQE